MKDECREGSFGQTAVMFDVQETLPWRKKEPVMVSEKENKMGEPCFKAVTFWDQLQGHGRKRGRAAVGQPWGDTFFPPFY